MGTEDLDTAYEAARKKRSAHGLEVARALEQARKAEYVEKVVAVYESPGGGVDVDDLHEYEVPKGGDDVAGWVLYRTPTRQEYARWRQHRFSTNQSRGAETLRNNADRELANACVVYPDEQRWSALCGRFPAMYDLIAARCLKLAEASGEEEGKG